MIGDIYMAGLATRLDDALAQLAQLVADEARQQVPVSSGQLRDSISVLGNAVVAEAPYAAAVEAREPFLRPALEAARGQIGRFL